MTIKFSTIKRFKILACLFIVFAAITAGTARIYALDESVLNFFAENNILFYEPCGTVASSYGSSVTVSGSTMEEKIWSGLTSFMSEEQAAGVMGNMAHEGLLNPVMHEQSQKNKYQPGFDLYNNSSAAYGLGFIQWSYDRRVGMLEYVLKGDSSLKTYFDNYNTYAADYSYNGEKFYETLKNTIGATKADTVANALVALELEYLQIEMKNSISMHLTSKDWNEYFNINNIEEAATYFLYYIEAPANPEASKSLRISDAKKYYEQFSGKTITGSSRACSGQGNMDINATAIDLAWPERGHDPWNDVKSNYKTALAETGINKLGDNCSMNGNSCDAFVTTVLRYSKVDENVICCGAENVMNYFLSHPEIYEEIPNTGQESDLLPGDILSNSGHVMIYVVDNGVGKIASASHCDRTGDLGPYNGHSGYHIFRAKNNINSGGSTSGCNSCLGGGNGQLISGGMTLEEAQEFMQIYHDLPSSEWETYDLSGYDCLDGPVANCVSFSKYFINKYTTVHVDGVGNGGDVADTLINTYGFEDGGSTPRVYAVFSVHSGSMMCGSQACGHTGVVLGIDVENDKIIIGEAGCGMGNGWTDAHEYSLSSFSDGSYKYAYTDSVLKL